MRIFGDPLFSGSFCLPQSVRTTPRLVNFGAIGHNTPRITMHEVEEGKALCRGGEQIKTIPIATIAIALIPWNRPLAVCRPARLAGTELRAGCHRGASGGRTICDWRVRQRQRMDDRAGRVGGGMAGDGRNGLGGARTARGSNRLVRHKRIQAKIVAKLRLFLFSHRLAGNMGGCAG
ncbi:hypothetical protein BCM02_101419 [Paenibacillus methanolicus]|uniref:Uncharacterized protein n=1 Tax=Paenibacillus methanolicus TaxID=582686 RepID=A0A5S5CL99_9BACL|nr:hypothetical protein BCM02_101419 [Paenibacillus methanolicus]